MQLVIVEDTGYRNFLPLTATRPVFNLICGSLSLADRIKRYITHKSTFYIIRDELQDVFLEQYPGVSVNKKANGGVLYVNGRVLWDGELTKTVKKAIRSQNKKFIFRSGDDWVALYTDDSENLSYEIFNTQPVPSQDEFEEQQVQACIITYPWDIIDENGGCIQEDFAFRSKRIKKKIQGKIHTGSVLTKKKDIVIGKNTVVSPFVVIDATKGPVIIEQDVTIEPHTYLQGPLWINNETIVKSGARIYGGTSIGFNCRAAGEIVSSIMHSFSNKAHEGFLGHSYIGQWINIGADTNNSNLKNDYGSIRVMINGTPVESGKQFFGMVMGDHSRTAINTMINTGTFIGVACNIFGANFPQKYIPDFSWGGADFIRRYQFDKFLTNAQAMTARRGVILSDSEITLLRKIYESRKTE